MKQYLLSIYQPEGPPPPAPALERVMRDVNRLVDETKMAGAWVFNGGLHPSATATVLRLQRGEMLVTDGPFAEGKEQIGGFLIIKVADLDSALAWGRKLATALTLDGRGDVQPGLAVEIRPFQGEAES